MFWGSCRLCCNLVHINMFTKPSLDKLRFKCLSDRGQTDGYKQKEVICSHQRCYSWMVQLLDRGRKGGVSVQQQCHLTINGSEKAQIHKHKRTHTDTWHISLCFCPKRSFNGIYWKLCTKSCTCTNTLVLLHSQDSH